MSTEHAADTPHLILPMATEDRCIPGDTRIAYEFTLGVIPRPGSYESARLYAEQFQRGVLPELSNGYSFVIDRRPKGQEDNEIPAEDYTAYFVDGQVPVADSDHAWFEHDMTHVDGYKRIFASRLLADITQAAAGNSVSNLPTCVRFATSIDGLGDAINSFWRQLDRKSLSMSDIRVIRLNLGELVELATLGIKSDEKEDLMMQLDEHFSLRAYEPQALANDREFYSRGYRLGAAALHSADYQDGSSQA